MSGELGGAFVSAAGNAAVSIGLNLITQAVFAGLHDASPKKSQPVGPIEVQNQSSGYVLALPLVFGKCKIAGNILWVSDGIRYSAVTGVVGNTGGKSNQDITADIGRYYRKTIAIGLASTRISAIRKIWADNVLVYDSRSIYKSDIGGFTLYDGSQTAPDPTLEQYQGAGNVPAYRDLSYVVLHDYAIAKFENTTGVYEPQPTALILPQFTFLVDGPGSSIHEYRAVMESVGYTSSYIKTLPGAPIYDPLIRSPFAFTQLVNDVTAWVDEQSLNSYAGIVSNINAIAALYPSDMVSEVIGQSYGGLDIVCARLFDDGQRRIIGYSQGIHGDERDCSWALEKFIELLITSNDPVYSYVREHFAVFIVATMNPDGMASTEPSEYGGSGTRNNGNDVNLNRNWPYYWDTVEDADKGAYAASEPETQAVINWLTAHGTSRIRFWCDIHGQNSRNDWGVFTEQIYHHPNVQRTQRACFNYAQSLLTTRQYIPGITFHPDGFGKPYVLESRSRRKPYIYTWIQQQVAGNCYGCIIEYPQIETIGLANTAMLDILKGFAAGACDSIQGELAGNASNTNSGGYAILPAYAPINPNSLFESWDSTDKRPSYFSVNGLRLSIFLDGQYRTRRFVRSYRPQDVGWPVDVAGAGYCVSADGLATDQFFICAGYNAVGELATLAGENLDTGEKTTNNALPELLRHGAMAYLGGHLYFAGGYDLGAGIYSNKLFRVSSIPDANGDISGWSQFSTLPDAVQRHSLTTWGTKLVLAGGRDAGGYLTAVRLFDTATGSWSLLANLATARGWHTAAVYNDTLYVFGGWNGANTQTSVEKVDLNTGTVTAGTALINSRAEQCIAVDGQYAYLIAGRTGSAIRSNVYKYDMAADTIEDLVYTMQTPEEAGDHDFIGTTTKPAVISAAAFFHPIDGYIGIVGGEQSSGLVSNRFYEFHPDNLDMYLRETDALTWGYVRTTQTHTGNPGDKFSLNIALRNPDSPADYPDRNPYARLVVIVGPLSNPQRKLRLGYFVPPQDSFRTYTIPFELQTGESEFRVYLRHYGGDTRLDIGAFQLVPQLTTGFIVPQAGASATTFEMDFVSPIDTVTGITRGRYNSLSASGAFSCIFGAQQNVDTRIFEFVTGAGSAVTLLEVWFTAAEDFTNGVVINPTWPDLISYPPTGRLYLKIRYGAGAIDEIDIFEEGEFELNYAKLNREWRLDTVEWRLATNGLDTWVEFSFYGTAKKIMLTGVPDILETSGDLYVFAYHPPPGRTKLPRTTPLPTFTSMEEMADWLNAHCWDTDSIYNRDAVFFFSQDAMYRTFIPEGLAITGIVSDSVGVIMSVSRTLSSVVDLICQSAGLAESEYDVSGLTGSLIGYANGQLTPARSLLDPLRAAFAFDVVESGGKLKFKSRATGATPVVIEETDLIAFDNGVLKLGTRQEAEMPRKISVNYIDPNLTFQQNTQTASIDAANSIPTDSAISLPLVLSDATAMQIAETLLASSWTGRYNYQFKTSYKWIHLEPSDLVTLNVGGISHTVILTGKQIYPSGYIEYSADQYSTDTYVSNATGTPGPVDNQTIALIRKTLWQLSDLPPLTEADNAPGFYVGMYTGANDIGTKWNGADFLKSTDDVVFARAGGTLAEATTGDCITTLGDPARLDVFDYKNTVDVTLISGAFTTISKDAVLDGGNPILIGSEILQFTTATLVSGDTYRLSGLLRGRLDTPATGHQAGEFAMMLDNGIERVNLAQSEIGLSRFYKGVTLGSDPALIDREEFIVNGAGLKPFKVAHIKGARATDGALTISWKRRPRINGHWANLIDVPLVETTESYEIDIMSGATVKRTLTSSTPSVTYTSGQQIADFGSNQSAVTVNIYQLSAIVGRGNKSTGTI